MRMKSDVPLRRIVALFHPYPSARYRRRWTRWRGVGTTLVIAHRLATVEWADQIVVLHRSRVVERGTHAEPLARAGRYAEMLVPSG